MKKNYFVILLLILLAGCIGKQSESNTSENREQVKYQEADNYFVSNDSKIPKSVKFTTQEEFSKVFGCAAVMEKDGLPTEIDFRHQFVLAKVLSVTDIQTEIRSLSLESKGDTLFWHYTVEKGDKQSYEIQPCLIIVVDRKYMNEEIVEN